MFARFFERRGRNRVSSCVALTTALVLGIAFSANFQCLAAAETSSPGLFRRQLAAGEFAPALATAEQIDHAPKRDAWLVQLAEAQAQAGASDGAFSTLAGVTDDRTRTRAVQAARKATSQGGSQANFDTLIDLITNTVRPTTWDAVGGQGTISPFQNGVYVDAAGELKRIANAETPKGLAVERVAALKASDNLDVRRAVPLRKVSLPRLEKYLQLRLAAGREPSEEMLNLAGLEKIRYVLVYPETGDLVLAGPASEWQTDAEGRTVSRTSGRPILQWDDLVVVLRYLTRRPQAVFGCSINPTEEGLARTKRFAEQSSAAPLKIGQRPSWLKKLRDQMGQQTISVDGIDPRTRVARVLVEADYRMKLVGMGLEDGTRDVPSYLDLVQVPRGQQPAGLDVLRWWFAMNYLPLVATAERDAFEIRGQGVRVMSENELLDQLGQRTHTGEADPLNQEFAGRFTLHFRSLAEKYPVYADLQNIFDLALVAALVNAEHLADRVHWHMTCLVDPDQYSVKIGAAPQSVESVINHRVIGGKHIIVGVSGGVRAEPSAFVRPEAISTETYGALRAQRANDAATDLPPGAWWWD